MMKINITKMAMTMLVVAFASVMSAQNKQFTLEDLNFGGTNYHNMIPKNMYLAWWGDQLMELDAEEELSKIPIALRVCVPQTPSTLSPFFF